MTIQEMQNIVHEWINQSKEGYFTPPWMVLRLTEELGELSREVSHVYGPKQKKPDEPANSIFLELGDLLFVIISMANSLDIDLEESFLKVMEKYQNRDMMRWTSKNT